MVLVIPAAIQADPDRQADFLASRSAVQREQFDRTAFHRELIERVRQSGLTVVDLLEALEAESESATEPELAANRLRPTRFTEGPK